MSKNDLYKKRNSLLRESIFLNSVSKEEKMKKGRSIDIKNKQNEVYRKWKFFDNFIKEMEKENGKVK